MKILVQAMAGLGTVAFLISFGIRLLNTGSILNASASGWWRGSIGLLAIGILIAQLALLNEFRKR